MFVPNLAAGDSGDIAGIVIFLIILLFNGAGWIGKKIKEASRQAPKRQPSAPPQPPPAPGQPPQPDLPKTLRKFIEELSGMPQTVPQPPTRRPQRPARRPGAHPARPPQPPARPAQATRPAQPPPVLDEAPPMGIDEPTGDRASTAPAAVAPTPTPPANTLDIHEPLEPHHADAESRGQPRSDWIERLPEPPLRRAIALAEIFAPPRSRNPWPSSPRPAPPR